MPFAGKPGRLQASLSRFRYRTSFAAGSNDSVSGEGPVEGFVLDFRTVWDPLAA